MDYYNGYTPQERARKLRALHKQFPTYFTLTTGALVICAVIRRPGCSSWRRLFKGISMVSTRGVCAVSYLPWQTPQAFQVTQRVGGV